MMGAVVLMAILLLLAVIYIISLRPSAPAKPKAQIPISVMPGPPRSTARPTTFLLNDGNSQRMLGHNDPANERWADISGNYYTGEFIRHFSYEDTDAAARPPVVRIQIVPDGDTLQGRLEAVRLKPNFAYQIKVRGDYARDAKGFEYIGYAGRWRLPGRGTNYTDQQYEEYRDKQLVEAYLLFDFFVTDSHGNAIREFALDSSLHVLWSATRQRREVRAADVLPVVVDASNPALYSRPKNESTVELVWAEREKCRYRQDRQRIRLPEHAYQAELVLVEESFHAHDDDGGFWATVYRCPISFEVLPR